MRRQRIGSLVAALLIVTAQFGPTSSAGLEAREERQDQRLDAAEERRKDAEDR